jgi:hypothetical protein
MMRKCDSLKLQGNNRQINKLNNKTTIRQKSNILYNRLIRM